MQEDILSDDISTTGDVSPAIAGPRKLSYSYAKRHGAIVTSVEPAAVHITLREGAGNTALIELRRHYKRNLKVTRVDHDAFDKLLQENYETSSSSEAVEMMEGLGEELDLSSIAQELSEPEDLLETEDDAPIIRLINALLSQAVKENASDIHIEPFENRLLVRLRIDGVLREVLSPPRALAPLVTSRIKVMAKLDIAEKRVPQDGRISFRIAGHPIDVRVSTLPSGHGERVVLRLLDKQAGRLDLAQLGMDPEILETMDAMIHKPHGIILVTGPTGSGKTTTLYAALGRLNDTSRNIMTVEDPIEYYIDGIGQTQVNTKVSMSFARGLRAILRQDPDVVMIGEIRDLETVEIAIQSSLTGHLVFSTLHTNTAIGAITRLRDMGVEPFLLSSSIIGVLAQRLVRILCPACKRPHVPDTAECELMGLSPYDPPVIYEPTGCEACNFLGYRGRTGIYELIEIDNHMRSLIHDGVGEHELELHARKTWPSIRTDGMLRILAG